MLQVNECGGEHWGDRGPPRAKALVGVLGVLALLTWLLIRKPPRDSLAGEEAILIELWGAATRILASKPPFVPTAKGRSETL